MNIIVYMKSANDGYFGHTLDSTNSLDILRDAYSETNVRDAYVRQYNSVGSVNEACIYNSSCWPIQLASVL